VLYQLSYAPWSPGIVALRFGHLPDMTDLPMEDMDRTQQDREKEANDLLEEQKGKGYGEDEGEREGALPEE
jgi:hypothetical protein